MIVVKDKCTPDAVCKAMAKMLDMPGHKGLVSHTIMNMRSFSRRSVVMYHPEAGQAGVILNFCPWCGGDINGQQAQQGANPQAKVWTTASQEKTNAGKVVRARARASKKV